MATTYELKMTEVDHVGADDGADFAIKRYSLDSNTGVETYVDTPFSMDQDTGAITWGFGLAAQTALPSALTAAGSANIIAPGITSVAVGANVNATTDFLTLPSLASVPVGHTITIVSNAAGHNVRTPATSNEKINNQDSDGTKQYAVPAGSQIHRFTKIDNTIGWMGQGFTAIGAVVAAVVPA